MEFLKSSVVDGPKSIDQPRKHGHFFTATGEFQNF